MDFVKIRFRETKEAFELYPDFQVAPSEDLMVRGGGFYAVWDGELGMWSRNESDVARLVDAALEKERQSRSGTDIMIRSMGSYSSKSWKTFKSYVKDYPGYYHPLDLNVTFANTEVKKSSYVSKRLPYALAPGPIEAWEELVSTLYDPEQRAKFEWAIGSIVEGDSKAIQKFLVFYGPAGTGKSTILGIIHKLFEGYTTAFDGKELGSTSGSFAMEVFKNHPLVAIQHDGDLSRLQDNTRLNSITAHETMTINEKYKQAYDARVDAMLFMGSNQPVKISDAKSGIIRRLIDVHPTGVKLPTRRYQSLMSRIDFELGAIAHHCHQRYLEMGATYYNRYRPLEMMLQTDVFFNFIEAYFDVFKGQDETTLTQAYKMYKEYCEETGIPRVLPMYKMREELRNYFDEFLDRAYVDGKQARSVYRGFNADKFRAPAADNGHYTLVLEETESLLDEELARQPAQLATPEGTPRRKWENVRTKLADLNTGELHFVKMPDQRIVIDFDLKDQEGKKALERNLEAASAWPSTYAEISKSGSGIHLHYEFAGDPSELATSYSEGIEVKVFQGDAALRRRLSRCNAVPVSTLTGGLPLKEKKEKMLQTKTIKSERGLRELITRNLRKEIHPGTKPSVDFIKKVLDDAYESGMTYDVSDMKSRVIAFAANSSNQSGNALSVVTEMKWSSENPGGEIPGEQKVELSDDRIVFFDVEVYPNLFVVCWKFQGSKDVVKMINPKPHEVEALFKLKLVGFYNRRYDNHILYAASMGAKPADLFRMSSRIIEGDRSQTYGAAYNLSYADIWDFSTERMSLKKFEIKLGILHMELDIPWDEPVDEKDWNRVVEYCVNDVRATEAVFEDRKSDFIARQILAELSGLTVNDTTQAHTAKIVFGNDVKTANKHFKYKNLAEEFPGYKYEMGKSSYKGEDPSEGGYVYAEPGMYENVAVMDVVSMHPTTIKILDLFGPYTKNYNALTDARVAIKGLDYEKARDMMGGRLAPFLEGAEDEEVGRHGTELAFALRIALNIVYGLTSAKFDNPFRDLRNKDNIVAKRGALFMIELKHYLQDAGFKVLHIKTDSVKFLMDGDPLAIAKVMSFGEMWGYTFEHEDTYDRFCLVNDAVFVAGKYAVPWNAEYPKIEWSATGAQFQHPYVFKSLFSKEGLEFDDYCEARSVVKGAMYLDRSNRVDEGVDGKPDRHKMRHIGKTGLFVPVLEGGGTLLRYHEEKYFAVSGTKGHQWLEADVAANMGDKLEIDYSYFEKLKDDAIATIGKFGDFEEFIEPER